MVKKKHESECIHDNCIWNTLNGAKKISWKYAERFNFVIDLYELSININGLVCQNMKQVSYGSWVYNISASQVELFTWIKRIIKSMQAAIFVCRKPFGYTNILNKSIHVCVYVTFILIHHAKNITHFRVGYKSYYHELLIYTKPIKQFKEKVCEGVHQKDPIYRIQYHIELFNSNVCADKRKVQPILIQN